MDDTTSKLAVYLVCFWVFLLVVGGVFRESLLLDQVDVNNPGDNTGRGNLILQIMTFQITDEVPVMLSVFLNVILIFSIYVLYMVLHPLK